MVRSMLVTACRLATSPTSTSPDLANATTEGVVRAPSALAMTVGSPPSSTATTLFVVPRSMPTAGAMSGYLRVVRPGGRSVWVWSHPGGGTRCLKILEPRGLKSDNRLNDGCTPGCSRRGNEISPGRPPHDDLEVVPRRPT